MKYRIVERVDGKFEIQRRKFFIWNNWVTYSNLEKAKNEMGWLISRKKTELEAIIGKKTKQVIQEFDA